MVSKCFQAAKTEKFEQHMDAIPPFSDEWKPVEGEQYCYALAMSGGGSFGSYETGVAWGLLHYGDPELYRWDVFTGVSAGSLNASMMSVWPKGQEVDMIEDISYQTTIVTPLDVVAPWPGPLYGIVNGLRHEAGLFDNSPMGDYLDAYFADFEKIEKKVVISAVDVNTGIYHPFDESEGLENLGTISQASASIPFAFAPTPYKGSLYMDGGTVWNINIEDAINKCLEIVPDEEHVVLDVAITEFLNMTQLDETGTTMDNMHRVRSIHSYYGTMNDVAEQVRSRPNINYRHFFKPSQYLGGW
jgi:predicted acylesterase/phospholipase RssA